MKKCAVFGAAAVVMLSLVFASCGKSGGGTIAAIKKAEVIRIGMFSDKIPFGYVDEKGEYQGYDVYFARRIAKDPDIAQLSGNPLPLIVNKGTTAEIYFRENHPDIPLLAFDQNTEAFNALKDGRGAALAHDNTEVFAWAILNPGFSVPNSVGSIGNADTINPAVRKGNAELLAWLNDEISAKLGDTFFHDDYKATLEPVYGSKVDPESVVVEKGAVR